jgi:hypothetical protein
MCPVLDELAVDSVTADIWVGANAPYVPSKNSRKTPDTVVCILSRTRDGFLIQLKLKQHVNYGDHAFFG